MSFLKISVRRILTCFLQVIILLFAAGIAAQQTIIPPVLSGQLENLSKNHIQEEVYIQTNKNIYETSEDLWFKGYVLDAQYFTPSLKSKTLYVSLLQLPEKKVVWEEKYAVTNGFTNGHIYVHDTLQPGHYALVAQTGYSVNPDYDVIRSARKIEVIQNIFALEGRNKVTEGVAIKPEGIDFQLMPEGGHLVAGITSKIAFKAVDKQGRPVDVKGTLFNGNKAVPGINTFHAGMGSFYITPNPGEVYFVKLDGYPESYPLPPVKPVGQAMQMLYEKDNVLAFKVTQSKGLQPQKMYIRLQMRGMVHSLAEFNLKDEKLIKIKVDNLPQGIAEITLFNADLHPVAERLVFINEGKKINLTTVLDKTDTGNKEKVTLKILAKDENGKPAVSHLGISVSDEIYHDFIESENIAGYYQLSAQLKGRICDPGYYFNEKNKNRRQALDLLLLTQGWRAYQWCEGNLTGQALKGHPFVSDTLAGSIVAKNKEFEKILDTQYMMTYTVDENSEKTLFEVNSKGNYAVLPEYLQSKDRGYVYFRLLSNKEYIGVRPINDPANEKLKKLRADKNFEFSLSGIKTEKTQIKEERFKAARNVNQLKEVVLTARVKKKRRFADKYIGKLDSLAMPDDYVCHLNVLNCPRHPINGRRPVEGQVYKDPFTDMQMGPYRYPNYTEEELLAKFNMTRIKGYYPPKEFYNPVYDGDYADNAADFRNTLFWKPDVVTDENGVAEVTFYTSDINSKFRVVVEGVTGDGLLGSNSTELKVDKKELK